MDARTPIAAFGCLPDLAGAADVLLSEYAAGFVFLGGPAGLSQLALKNAPQAADLAFNVWLNAADLAVEEFQTGLVSVAGAPLAVLGLAADAAEFELARELLQTLLAHAPAGCGKQLDFSRILEAGDCDSAEFVAGRGFSDLIDKAVDAVFICDDRSFLISSRRFQNLTGLTADRLERVNLSYLFGQDFGCPQPGSFDSQEVRYCRPDGITLWFEVNTFAVRLKRGDVLAGIARDITDRRQANEIRERFVQVASHELRSPLTVIRGYARLLLKNSETGLDLEQREMLAEVCDQAERLTSFCNSLLEFSAAAGGKLKLERKSCQVLALMAAIVEHQRVRAAEKQVEIELVCAQQSLPEISLDALRFEQVLVNLLDNAIKFSPAGGVIRVGVDMPDAASLAVMVSDEGVGVDPQEAAQLFDEFFVGSSGRERQGFGLGLPLVREIVRAHGGSVRAESSSNGGRFIVTLPLMPAND